MCCDVLVEFTHFNEDAFLPFSFNIFLVYSWLLLATYFEIAWVLLHQILRVWLLGISPTKVDCQHNWQGITKNLFQSRNAYKNAKFVEVLSFVDMLKVES